VHVREDGRDRASLSWRFRSPRGWVELLDQHLIDAIVDRKDFHGGSTDLISHLGSTRRHVSLLLEV
jgi:hypothetical protein